MLHWSKPEANGPFMGEDRKVVRRHSPASHSCPLGTEGSAEMWNCCLLSLGKLTKEFVCVCLTYPRTCPSAPTYKTHEPIQVNSKLHLTFLSKTSLSLVPGNWS
jgi:hypothetical protein